MATCRAKAFFCLFCALFCFNQLSSREMIDRETTLSEALRSAMTGGYLLTLVLITPHEGSSQGESFLEGAKHSAWNTLGNWAAAWCSLKIILFSIGVWCLLLAAWRLLAFVPISSRWRHWALCIPIAPSVGVLIGVYYATRAVL